MKINRFIFPIIAAILLMSILSGCSNNKSDNKETTKIDSATTPSSPEGTDEPSVTNPSATQADTTSTPTEITPQPDEYKYQKYHIEVSLKAQIVYIYDLTETGEKGNLVKAMICSTGRPDAPTPMQKWIILSNDVKQYSSYRFEYLNNNVAGQFMSRMWNVREDAEGNEEYYWSSYLFHSVPYSQKNSESLVIEYWNNLGTPVSDGCVRLATEDAKWIYTYVAPYSYVYTIEGEENPELWAKLKHDPLPADAKRDPTDVDNYPES